AFGESRGHLVDGIGEILERCLAIGPTKQVVACKMLAAARFHERKAGQKPPIEAVRVGLAYKNTGVPLGRTVIFYKKLAEDSLPQVELFADFRYILFGVRGRSRYAKDSRENHDSRGQKALHSMSFSFG
ncbi:MAG: hypothetical protein KGN84_03285, partial [Acidobacteriota bacterium]|nr:hypothetical protein [Acidobacteriota bacterium]